ncbi:MAG TPA: hypothetical protein DDY31_00070 [Lachnospiraceae bacterium]|nr:hypothetical protein [Lachnospiraceae bacterium]
MDTLQIIVIQIGTQYFGVQITQLKKIVWTDKITENIKMGNPFVTRMLSLDDQNIPVFDIHKKLKIEHLEKSSNLFAVCSTSGKLTAFCVDAVNNSYEIPIQNLKPIPPVGSTSKGLIKGIITMGKHILLMLDLSQLCEE